MGITKELGWTHAEGVPLGGQPHRIWSYLIRRHRYRNGDRGPVSVALFKGPFQNASWDVVTRRARLVNQPFLRSLIEANESGSFSSSDVRCDSRVHGDVSATPMVRPGG